MKAYSIPLLIFLVFHTTGILAQETIPSKIKLKQLDSLRQVWQLKEEKRMEKARGEFLEKFDKLPDSLPVLNMNRLGLTVMPDISRFNQLKELHAKGNKFTKVPKSTFSSKSLRFVDLSGNLFEKLIIPRKSAVVSLKMEGCSLQQIPRPVRKLKNLKRLYLGKNDIVRIPLFVKRMKKLTEINLNFNRVELNLASAKRLKNIKLILLAGNGLESLPENIDQLAAAKQLNLSKNKLSELPSSFSKLDSLKGVIFYENSFSTLPIEVLQLRALEELDFYYNNIEEIPIEIANLQNLERLYLSFNKIKVLPDTMRSLKKLRRLYIHHNRLVVVPQWITEIDSLEVLDVGYNQIIDFPDVSEMPRLYEVDIQDNAIGEIPWKLANKENLKLLFLKNNLFLEDENSRSALKRLQKEREAECVIVMD